ncbi:MAG TPA: transposase zinc-binding domain-containing protein, partial [Polyangia bacterium]
AIEEGWQTGLPEFVRAEFAGFLDCSVMQRGFAHLACEDCSLPRLVAFTSAGRGFCPTCLGRRMNQTGEMRQSILGCLKKITSLVPKAGCCGPNR